MHTGMAGNPKCFGDRRFMEYDDPHPSKSAIADTAAK
jgi:hypothetical protein